LVEPVNPVASAGAGANRAIADKDKIVVSAITARSMGTLTIVQDCLEYLSGELANKYEVIAILHQKALADYPNVRYLEFPNVKKSYVHRLAWEYAGFRKISEAWRVRLWLSLQDITPNVRAERRAVYCHNPSPFCRLSLWDALIEPKFGLFHWVYPVLYRINIQKNDFVIVQQEWLRREFKRRFGIEDVIVARPEGVPQCLSTRAHATTGASSFYRFFYPSYPRVFKNIELVCEAVQLLNSRGIGGFEVLLTIGGSENAYARILRQRFAHLHQLKFLGLLTRADVFSHYGIVDCLIFPSKLETWGLPISEFKTFDKPILAADLGYAYETLGDYSKAAFFNPADAKALADLMEDAMKGNLRFSYLRGIAPVEPFAKNWAALFDLLLN
jgi:glycosyltransferase involved in cell wall biosynthesis